MLTSTKFGVIVVFSILTGIFDAADLNNSNDENTLPQYQWRGCENLGKCQLDGFSEPPLVILSFDGFARKYLERRIVKSLEFIAECGVQADRVYPSFPSKTFPNHYTLVTGLYPEYHGIIDNNVYDPTLSPELLAMRNPAAEKFYGGEPIWSAYKRLTGKRAHCLFWVGCYFKNARFKPDVSPDYNQSLPLNDRIATLIRWLKLPVEERPGLITAYLHEPDNTGHRQKSAEDVNVALKDVDKYIDALMKSLYDEELLECINLVILSDHGMQVLNKTVAVEDFIDVEGLILSKGVVTRIHLNATDRSVDEVADQMRCKVDGVKVNTVNDIPLRKHYSKSKRIGDIVIEGNPGTTFLKIDDDNQGDHGYDYYNENMHTVMFARGPSFETMVTVPSFQNVQYMNLWLSLLGIEGAVENNGTIGFFDSILKNAPIRENSWDSIEECPTFGSPDALQCSGKLDEAGKKVALCLERRSVSKSLPIYSNNSCYQRYCDNMMIVKKNNNDSSRTVVEILTWQSKKNISDDNFSFINTQYGGDCPTYSDNDHFFTAGTEAASKIANARHKFPDLFVKNILRPLNTKTVEYLKRFGALFVVSGLSTGASSDEIVGKDELNVPIYFYRILITCTGRWLSRNPPLCQRYSETRALAFAFPILGKKTTMDCMSSDDVLLEYTATIEDVERIAAFKFEIGALSHQQNVHLRRNITTSLW